MGGWNALGELGVVVRPFDGPPPEQGDSRSQFKAGWGATLDLLSRELRALRATQVVLEMAVEEKDLRLDGLPRATAKPSSQAVRLSFESKHGPVRIDTGEYDDWQDNVRAIALSLEALRSVDRYGVSKRGEQYRGWRQIAAQSMTPEDAVTTRSQALEALARVTGRPVEDRPEYIRNAVREARRKAHPDAGGSEEQFRLVEKAKAVLGV